MCLNWMRSIKWQLMQCCFYDKQNNQIFFYCLIKHEKEMHQLKHFLFQYFSMVLAGTHVFNEICLTVYPILFFICKIYFLNKYMLMTYLRVQSISSPGYLQVIIKKKHLVYYNTTLYVDLWI
jgi:hypothetical protein